MLDEKNMLGVKDWTGNVRELEKQLADTQEKLHFSRTIVERQKLSALQNEVAEGYKQVKAMNKKAYEVAIANKAASLMKRKSSNLNLLTYRLMLGSLRIV
jgi:transcriptional regulator with PAS, ATPase and Fis domain